MRTATIAACGAVLLLAACGSDTSQRASTGALTGAGVGALVGGPIGAAVGLGVGGAAGWATPEGADQVAANAIHKEHAAGQTALNDAGLGPSQQQSSEAIKTGQAELKREGYYGGNIDGIAGSQTRKATSDFQKDAGLQQTAQLDAATMDALRQNNTANQPNHPQERSGSSVPPDRAAPTQSTGATDQNNH